MLAWILGTGILAAQELAPQAPTTPPPSDKEAAKPYFEEWSVLFLDGRQCGFESTITTRVNTSAGPGYLTVHQEEFVVKRLQSSFRMIDTSRVTEDAAGAVLSFEQNTAGSGSDISSSGYREGEDIVVTSRGQTQRYHVPRLSALGPEAVRRQSLALKLHPGLTYVFHTFASDYPQSTVISSGTVQSLDTRNVRGIERNVWTITSETSLMPGLTSTAWIDEKGNDVESLMVIPGIGDLHEYVTNRAECMKQVEGAEIFATTLIHPKQAIKSPEKQAQAIYRLTSAGMTQPFDLWNEGEQRVLRASPGSSDIEVTVPTFNPADATWRLPHIETPELQPYLQGTSYLEIHSPEIQHLAKQAVGSERNPVVAARKIETFVRGYITKKDLTVGFASAQETAKSREGDCTEHAVLCAAIGRAAGLPTRIVVGLGYIPPGMDEPTVADAAGTDTGVFGFHMWAEAWIGPGKWMPMDAALDGFDVGHIAITKTALAEVNPLLDLNTPILQLMQHLQIRVLDVVPKGAPRPAKPAPLPASELPHPEID